MELPQAKTGRAKSSDKSAKSASVKDDESAGEFEAQLSQIGQQLNAASKALGGSTAKHGLPDAQTKEKSASNPNSEKLAVTTALLKGKAGQRMGLTPSAEQSPATMKSAVSGSTGSAIAGLKPWSKDWVFEGADNENPYLKPLFGKSEAEAAQEGLKAQAEKGGANQLNPLVAQLAAQLAKKESELGATRGDGDSGAKNIAPQKTDAEVRAALVAALKESPQKADKSGEHSQLLKQLGLQASLLNGAVTDVNAGPHKAVLGESPGQSRLAQRLSGDEFLSTLKSVQGNHPAAIAGLSAGAGFEQSGNSTDNSGGNSDGQGALQGKPNLRVIEGGNGRHAGNLGSFDSSLGAQSATLGSAPSSHLGASPQVVAPTVVTGHVVQGSMAQDRLSSETVIGMSSSIRTLSANGGGEMRIRLKPENLGELHVRVMTDGTQVGLHIQANDEKAKKILEESLGHLKESLATQNLKLGHVDFTVAKAAKSEGGEMNHSSQWQNQSARQDQMQQNSEQNRQNGWSKSNAYDSGDFGPGVTSAVQAQASPAAYSASGRLDVKA
jgi:hypothetical protein